MHLGAVCRDHLTGGELYHLVDARLLDLEIDRSRMTFSCEGRKKALTFADVINLTQKEICKLKR